MMARLFLLLLCLAGLGTAQAQVRAFDDIVASGVLKVAVYEDFPPYSFRADGQARGVDVELAQKLADSQGLALELLWSRRARSSKTTCAISSGRATTCARTCWPT